MEEVWKTYPKCNFVEISSMGRIRTLDRVIQKRTRYGGVIFQVIKGKELKQSFTRGRYLFFAYSKEGIIYQIRTNRAVAETFIPNLLNKPEVNHINGVKTDNRVENLEWVTAKENSDHAIRTGLKRPHKPTKRWRKVKCVETKKIYESTVSAAKNEGCNASAVRNVLCGSSKTSNNKHFVYI